MNVIEDIVITPLAVTILPSGFDLVRVQRSIESRSSGTVRTGGAARAEQATAKPFKEKKRF